MTQVDRECPKCKGIIRACEPQCTNRACITKSVISYSITPEGYLSFIEDHKYPLRGLPVAEVVNHVALLKRCLIATIRPITESPLVILALLLTPKKKLLRQGLEWMHCLYISDYNGVLTIPPEAFCTSAREIKRTLEKVSEKNGIIGNHWITLLQTIYETDMAYRYRFQNILEETDKVALKKNPRKEVMRLLQLNIDREVNIYGLGQTEKAVMAKRVVWVSLWFKPFRNLLVDFLTELDLSKVKMDLYDRYWVTERFDYNYNGISFEDRQIWRKKEHDGWVNPIEPFIPTPDAIPVKPAITVNQPNEAFFRLPLEGAEHMAGQVKDAIVKLYKDRHINDKA